MSLAFLGWQAAVGPLWHHFSGARRRGRLSSGCSFLLATTTQWTARMLRPSGAVCHDFPHQDQVRPDLEPARAELPDRLQPSRPGSRALLPGTACGYLHFCGGSRLAMSVAE